MPFPLEYRSEDGTIPSGIFIESFVNSGVSGVIKALAVPAVVRRTHFFAYSFWKRKNKKAKNNL
jgi:hypothetical protein